MVSKALVRHGSVYVSRLISLGDGYVQIGYCPAPLLCRYVAVGALCIDIAVFRIQLCGCVKIGNGFVELASLLIAGGPVFQKPRGRFLTDRLIEEGNGKIV